jgi:tRNA dimethylallyltransferase
MIKKSSTINYQSSAIQRPLLVVVGPTASGKSKLALELAQALNGEIICADSRTVYKGMDIGTAKPTKAEQAAVPHHMLDIVEPDQDFTVADFKQLANQVIEDVQRRGKLPIMVGGSGLYIDAVLYDFGFSEAGAARDKRNPRHLSDDVPRKQTQMRSNTVVVGLFMERDELKKRIEGRVEQMVANGFDDEVKRLQADYRQSKALLTPGYKAFIEHLAGHLSLEEAKALFVKNDFQLAKRQMTWFKRNPSIHWLSNSSTYVKETLKLLNKLQ